MLVREGGAWKAYRSANGVGRLPRLWDRTRVARQSGQAGYPGPGEILPLEGSGARERADGVA